MADANGSERVGGTEHDRTDRARGSFGANAWLVDDMFERFVADPASVGESWRECFADYRPDPVPRPVPAPPRRAPESHAPPAGRAGERTGLQAAPAAPSTVTLDRSGAEPVALRGPASRIAANMQASLGVPTATSVRVVPARLLEINRQVLNDQLARTTGAKVSFTHLIGYAVVRALTAVPALNATFVADIDGKGTPGVLRHPHVGLGLAVDVERGDGTRTLLVPCVKDADTLDFRSFVLAYEELIRKVH